MKKSSWEKEIGNWLKLKGKGKNHPFLVMANFVGIWETTGIIKRLISLVIWDPKKSGMPRSGGRNGFPLLGQSRVLKRSTALPFILIRNL